MTTIAGFDVGGAHLKIARVENGRPVAATQFVCPLWQGLEQLDAALAEARTLTDGADIFAITMTGELSDLFETRQAGVATLVDRMQRATSGRARYWMGRKGFGRAAEAKANHVHVGSTNFLATALAIAAHRPDALLIDLGSTTTDIIPIVGGAPVPQGLTDAERQTTGELVYTGYTRTSVMGVAQSAPLMGRWVTLAREHLATMADVRRILGSLPEGVDLHATADGKGKSLAESLARFARLFGRDSSDAGLPYWQAAARYIEEQQRRSILDGVHLVLSRAAPAAGLAGGNGDAPIVAAGTGAAAIQAVARTLGRPCLDFGALIGADESCRLAVTHLAPAVAVALLAAADPDGAA